MFWVLSKIAAKAWIRRGRQSRCLLSASITLSSCWRSGPRPHEFPGGYIPRKIETQFSTVWAINDFTKENGATQLVPGSHKWDKNRQPEIDEIAYAEMKAGSVFIYTGSVLHGGGANSTDESRLGVFLHYAPSWLRQEENQYLSCPPEVAEKFSPELRSLIGYSKGGYVLGFFSDPNDKEGKLESVSPEKIFGESKDKFESLATPENLVKESTK